MKKLSICIILSFSLFGSLFAKTKPLSLEPIQIEPIIKSNEYIDVIADPRIELIGIICRLAGINGFTNYYTGEVSYTTQIDSYFTKYKDEKAVTLAKSLVQRGIGIDAILSLAYHIKPDFSGTVINFEPYPETLFESWKKISTREIYNFIKAIHDFAIKTNYQRFSNLTRSELLSHVGYFYKDFEDFAICKWVDSFFNNKSFDKIIISVNKICPLYCAYDTVIDENNTKLSYTTVYPSVNLIDMVITYFDNYVYQYVDMLWPEVEEQFTLALKTYYKKTNPEEYKEIIKNLDAKQNLVNYTSIFLFLEYLRSPIYLDALKDKEENQYIHYEAIYGDLEKAYDADWFYKIHEIIGKYANNRDEYPTFESIFPEIKEVINSIEISDEVR